MTAAQMARVARSLVAVKYRRLSDNGSGCVIGHDATGTLILTVAHALRSRQKTGAVTIRTGRKFVGHKFEVVRKDEANDLALLRTETLNVRPIVISSMAPHLYDRVYVIGCPAKTETHGPEAYFGSVVEARLSGMNGSNMDEDSDYQLSAPIGGGMSGSMVLNEAGQLVGVAKAGDDGAFVSFATSLENVKAFLSVSPKFSYSAPKS